MVHHILMHRLDVHDVQLVTYACTGGRVEPRVRRAAWLAGSASTAPKPIGYPAAAGSVRTDDDAQPARPPIAS